MLGPLLFCLYINDVKDHLPDNIFHLIYADDLQVYFQVSPESVTLAIETLSLITRKVSDWADSVSLRLNHSKSKVIFFGSSTFVDRLNRLNYPGIDMGNGIIIPFEKEVKSLGVILDSKLTWESHITSIEKKVNRVLYTLRFIRHCTTETLRTRLVQALVTPHLDYCNTVYLDANKELKGRLQRLSNSGLRYIFGIRKDMHITPYRQKLGWLCNDTRRLYFEAILLYKILRLGQPQYLVNLFVKYSPKSNARGQLKTKELSLPGLKECSAQSFQFHGTVFWNSIPSKIRFLPSLNNFKKEIFKYLLSLDP